MKKAFAIEYPSDVAVLGATRYRFAFGALVRQVSFPLWECTIDLWPDDMTGHRDMRVQPIEGALDAIAEGVLDPEDRLQRGEVAAALWQSLVEQ